MIHSKDRTLAMSYGLWYMVILPRLPSRFVYNNMLLQWTMIGFLAFLMFIRRLGFPNLIYGALIVNKHVV